MSCIQFNLEPFLSTSHSPLLHECIIQHLQLLTQTLRPCCRRALSLPLTQIGHQEVLTTDQGSPTYQRNDGGCYHQRLTGRSSAEVSLRLQNSGSVARDHLALERTFLAYMRTSLAIASAGVALVQLFNTSNTARSEREDKLARPLGAFIIAVGLSVLGIGLGRYFTVQSALVKGAFPVARLSTAFIAVVLIVLVTAAFSLLLGGKLKLG
ncbi:hypothetical protein AGABI1DRAFT_113908 [Agaricus bisporus var. burnettii JB137-S8]|uniref:DUF202 domain-containing protein n=2 Tax=Agaricus bisporus var. burnettii TaxID=192524 RepID=K5X8K7_AGABU|nr:uncharacterized protein AGABI1DRAFT_113908 [Agaricus bisporus var. burnettii JB137-S8]EKM79337.1 hypothetical protein AGABI1DRAFT_113908 [Agaricus bisporus var. burnettii JB137-S8]